MSKRKRSGSVKSPNPVLFHALVPAVKLYYRLAYRHKIDKSEIAGIKPPFLAVAGHSCWLDYLITMASMYPHKMNYVGAYNFFRNRVLKTVFTGMGVIPKHQFTNDVSAIRKIKRCIDDGRAVALFPHGCLSNEGRPGGFATFGVAKLIKHLSVPVVAIHTDGGYLTRPRWSKKARHGRLETKITQVLSRGEVEELSADEIYRRVLRAIDFDDYKWQRERMIPFTGKRVTEGAEYVLYRCPRCESEFTLRAQGNRLYCEACGNAAVMNRYLLFEPADGESICPDGIDRWYDMQREELLREIQNPAFELRAETELLFAEPGKYGYQHQGIGEVRLNREAIIYTGTVKGEQTQIVLPMKNIPMIPYAANEYIEVAFGEDIHRFVLYERRQMMKWVMAVRAIRDQFYEEVR